jgi:hypothetical protein
MATELTKVSLERLNTINALIGKKPYTMEQARAIAEKTLNIGKEVFYPNENDLEQLMNMYQKFLDEDVEDILQKGQ